MPNLKSLSSRRELTDEGGSHNRRWIIGFIRWIDAYLIGYDIFVSYTWSDGRDYARALVAELKRKRYRCFLDSSEYKAGSDLNRDAKRAVWLSSAAAIVVTPSALRSHHVRKEIRLFDESEKPLVPIDVDGTMYVPDSSDGKTMRWIPSPVIEEIIRTTHADEQQDIQHTFERISRDRKIQIAEGSKEKPSSQTIEKLCELFSFTRRVTRRLRLISAACLLLVVLAGIAVYQGYVANVHLRDYKTSVVFRLLEREIEAMPASNLKNIRGLKDDFEELNLDPLMVLHLAAAHDLNTLPHSALVDVNRGVSYLMVSEDGQTILVVYDYQDYGGNPDLEAIPNEIALAVFDLESNEWVLEQMIESDVGSYIYALHPSLTIAFEGPCHVVLANDDAEGNVASFSRYSLVDGTSADCSAAENRSYSLHQSPVSPSITPQVEQSLDELLDPKNLFLMHPDDFITARSPRYQDQVYVISPNGRTALVGSYEGRLMLVDLATGLVRGETRVGAVFAADYSPDGGFCYICDESEMLRLDCTGWSWIEETSFKLVNGGDAAERVLGIALSDDDASLGVATTHRIARLSLDDGSWSNWQLPSQISSVAALRVDSRRECVDVVAGKNGLVFSASEEEAELSTITHSKAGEAVVAWLDEQAPIAWLSPSDIEDETAMVLRLSLESEAESIAPMEFSLTTLLEETQTWDRKPSVHGLCRIDDCLFMVFGDDGEYSDYGGLLGEELCKISITDSSFQYVRTLREVSEIVDDLGEHYWSNTSKVRRILPGASSAGFLFRLDGGSIDACDLDGDLDALGSLTARTYRFGKHTYAAGISGGGNKLSVTLLHKNTSVRMSYDIDWPYDEPPFLALLSSSGGQIIAATQDGRLIIADVSSFND
jgi:TIR domain-containing protein